MITFPWPLWLWRNPHCHSFLSVGRNQGGHHRSPSSPRSNLQHTIAPVCILLTQIKGSWRLVCEAPCWPLWLITKPSLFPVFRCRLQSGRPPSFVIVCDNISLVALVGAQPSLSLLSQCRTQSGRPLSFVHTERSFFNTFILVVLGISNKVS